jgi:hypothetical protein
MRAVVYAQQPQELLASLPHDGNAGMNDAWLESQGLVSVRTLWIAYHYPAANQSGKRDASR